ncbi:hypothetical protein M8745_18755 [Lutimaribacter sp. EGI FJ00014]|nr:hypothetical protein [Lutimaribacter sp. EGI FJ00014]
MAPPHCTPEFDSRSQASSFHLWYEKPFGGSYPRLPSAMDDIDHFFISGICVGIDVRSGGLYAPNGVQAAWNGILAFNPKNPAA